MPEAAVQLKPRQRDRECACGAASHVRKKWGVRLRWPDSSVVWPNLVAISDKVEACHGPMSHTWETRILGTFLQLPCLPAVKMYPPRSNPSAPRLAGV
ncbi:hypothetical protein J1614_009723 [Plenodomus biglobosus]|nr:hypothetical protein J1614_009723 [Plenodomus biglobosus]